jgi:hypothetical protein
MKFFDPHPGMMGAAVPLPEKVRKLAASLDGKRETVRSVLARVKKASPKGFDVGARSGCIMLYSSPTTGAGGHEFEFPQHCWRVLRYKR